MNPYMRLARKAAYDFLNKDWLQGWQWLIEIETKESDAPADFDIYAKDIDLGLGSIDYDMTRIGAGEIALPSFSSAGEITMTVRDDSKLTVHRWMKGRLDKVKNKDGTVNLPVDYVFKVKIYMLDQDGAKSLLESYNVAPAKIGNATFSREGINEFYSVPLIFQKFMSVGSKNI